VVEGWDSGRVGAASVAAGFATAAPKPVSPLAADKALLLLPACRVEAAVADCGCDPKENPGRTKGVYYEHHMNRRMRPSERENATI
jgi:hypothetical protein